MSFIFIGKIKIMNILKKFFGLHTPVLQHETSAYPSAREVLSDTFSEYPNSWYYDLLGDVEDKSDNNLYLSRLFYRKSLKYQVGDIRFIASRYMAIIYYRNYIRDMTFLMPDSYTYGMTVSDTYKLIEETLSNMREIIKDEYDIIYSGSNL